MAQSVFNEKDEGADGTSSASVVPFAALDEDVVKAKDPRLLLGHICHAYEPEAVVHIGVKWHNENDGLAPDYNIPIEYYVLFAPRDPRNERGSYRQWKNSQRMQLKAVLRALQAFAKTHKQGQNLLINTEFDVPLPYMVKEERNYHHLFIQDQQQGLRSAFSPDLMLQVEELIQWLANRGSLVSWKQFALLPEPLEKEYGLLRAERDLQYSEVLNRQQTPVLPREVVACPSWYFMRVYTDGSTISVNGAFSGGYGVYFGYFDPRSECGPICGKGTGPRASLVAIVRALELIAQCNNGHRRWEIACNREQYIRCVFELTERWKAAGWKRNSGKPIANLDLYRGARRILDKLVSFNFELRGIYVSQREMDRGIMVADLLARRGAGDQSIDLPFRVNTAFEAPLEPEDRDPSTVFCSITGEGSSSHFGPESRLNGSWTIKFGTSGADPRDRNGSTGTQSRARTCATVLMKLLRIIEGEPKRYWVVYVNFNDMLTYILDQLSENMNERPERHERHEGRLRSHSGFKFMSTPYMDALLKRMRRLERHGYDISFRPSSMS